MKDRIIEIADLLVFFKKGNLFYLIPFILLLVIIGLLVVLINTTPAAVFIYPLI